jgi:hypothetical protein
MKELYGEGLASHTDPESCVASRKAGREALTGAHVSGVLSREMSGNQDADTVYSAGRPHWWARYREHPLDLRGQRPPTCMERPASAVRAICGSTACTDPRGGRWATGVPTATP